MHRAVVSVGPSGRTDQVGCWLLYGRLARGAGWVAFTCAVLALVGCGSKSPTTAEAPVPAENEKKPGRTPVVTPAVTPKTKPTITANPNPVPAGDEKFGTTTISWDTGDGTVGEVYVSVNGGEEKRFSGAQAKGSQEASWIGYKSEYEFRLYAGKEHATKLATVRVTRSK
jgi:hypothetical protein